MVNYPDIMVIILIVYQLSLNSQSIGAEKSCDNTKIIHVTLQDCNAYNAIVKLLPLNHTLPDSQTYHQQIILFFILGH